MVKAVVFDNFGVLVGSGFDDTYLALGGDPRKDASFINNILHRANTGLISLDEFRREIKSKLNITEKQYQKTVNETEQINHQLFDYIRKFLKPKYKIALLSNASAGTIERILPEDLRRLFDEIIVSAEVGLLKPNPVIYEFAANKLGIEPGEVVFVDDSPQHTAGAELAGMKAIQYTNLADLKDKLDDILSNKKTEISYSDIVRKMAGEGADVVLAPASHINEVYLANEKEVYRFPKTKKAEKQQIFEWDVLEYLNLRSRPPVAIPKPVQIIDQPLGFVYQYIAGRTVSEEELLSWNAKQKKEFIENLLDYIHWQDQAISPEMFRKILSSSKGKKMETWADYISRTVGKYQKIEHEPLREVSEQLFNEIKQHYPDGLNKVEDRVIHDDLHTGNLLFDESNKLAGVIDFGDVTLADLACEFRHFYRLSPEIARQACGLWNQKYDEKVDFAKIEFWAKISEATTLIAKVQQRDFSSPSFKRTRTNFAKWYPEKNWNF